jgi:hypothetical protein
VRFVTASPRALIYCWFERQERHRILADLIGRKPMMTYHYALICNPCESTVNALLEFARAHPGCLHTLPPADSVAMRSAIAAARGGHERQFAAEDEAFASALDGRTLS